MDTDLEKLRRFCITAALVLITYMLADITITPNAEVKIFEVPFTVKRPDLLPIGIVLACFLGMVRFAYYGFLTGISPYRKRRLMMNSILGSKTTGSSLLMYLGSSGIDLKNAPENMKRAQDLVNVFPRFLRGSAHIKFEGSTPFLLIPFRSRIALVFEDLDYSAPVWLSILALFLLFWPSLRRI
jgi:hypothetical protein